jgi:hypothetical protein
MQIDKNLYNEINDYCKLNELKTRDFIHKILKEGFLREKYGDSPFVINSIKKEATEDNEIQKECDEIILDNKKDETPSVSDIQFHETFISALSSVDNRPKNTYYTKEDNEKTPDETHEQNKPKRKRKLK